MWEQYRLVGSIEEAASALSEIGEEARIIAGGTDLILEIERGIRKGIKALIDISAIPGLDEIKEDQDGVIHIGPLVTHNHIVASSLIREKAYALLQACWEVGSPQIRNRGTVAGNLVTGSPANDSISPLMVFDAKLSMVSKRGNRVVALSDFYRGVRQTVLAPDEVIADIFFDAPGSNQQSYFIKSALRKAQAISVINISVLVTLMDETIQNTKITLGAVAPTIIHALEAEDYLIGRKLNDGVVNEAAELIVKAANPISDIRGSADYRAYLISVMAKRALKSIRDGVDKNEIPSNPVLLMGSGLHVPPPKEPWNGKEIHTWINGKEYRFTTGFNRTLLHLIREEAGLMGTKEGCGEGECGACTVFMDGRAVMSCLVPAPRAHGSEIVTIEGLQTEDVLHPLQEAFIEYGAIQCGYCTPGFLMSSAKLLEERMTPSQAEIRQAITGNLCRCTGYYKIIEAIEKASKAL
ncbi:MAG: FAD binding domain-containing protein [Chloroflexota bacterium]|nr:FAD binding domain-containing protein [Chloroflexota bacterium]